MSCSASGEYRDDWWEIISQVKLFIFVNIFLNGTSDSNGAVDIGCSSENRSALVGCTSICKHCGYID